MNSFGCMKIQQYLDTYDEMFKDIKHYPVSVLELGVLGGQSLLMWNDFFTSPDRQIVGLDMSPPVSMETLAMHEDTSRIFQYQGMQDNLQLLKQVAESHGPFDIVIDDASHRADPTRESLKFLWNFVKPGGFYVIEDWGTGYWDPSRGFDGTHFQGGNHLSGMVGLIKELVDLTGSNDWPNPVDSPIEAFTVKWGQGILKKK